MCVCVIKSNSSIRLWLYLSVGSMLVWQDAMKITFDVHATLLPFCCFFIFCCCCHLLSSPSSSSSPCFAPGDGGAAALLLLHLLPFHLHITFGCFINLKPFKTIYERIIQYQFVYCFIQTGEMQVSTVNKFHFLVYRLLSSSSRI